MDASIETKGALRGGSPAASSTQSAGASSARAWTREAILERNLTAIAKTSPRAAALLREATPRTDILFSPTRDRESETSPPRAVLSASQACFAGLAHDATPIRLASSHHPLEEARALADTIDLKQAGAVVVMGFGVGHHIAEVARRMRRRGVVYVFEPDLNLIRTVLERIDHSAWIQETNLVILHDATDTGAMTEAMTGVEAIIALGVKFLEHPASRKRLGEQAAPFRASFTSVVRAVRTNIVTTLVHADLTMRNLLMNLDHYALRPGVDDLAGIAKGKPAIVVAAGPSLKRNLHLLSQPGVRDRVVIVAVQTVLKTLLERGIKPHFVTALDYAEISTRFYEGLSARDVEGVTLVAEAKANPAILSAFPGEIRCPGDGWLDGLLGKELAVAHGTLRAGSTVAHLAYYLARHLGCDPVVLIGQDLGFTDGQYYASGAVIHNVWASELNEFRTLEMFEWERIARWKHNLIAAKDHLGRPVYTDEQMATYRVQFERDFASDAAKGLRTIDATEGGVAKQHTETLELDECLKRYATSAATPFAVPTARSSLPAREAVARRVDRVREDVARVASLSRRTKAELDEMLAHHDDQARVNRLIARVDATRDEVQRLQPAFDLVQLLNQTGLLKRLRADRELDLDDPRDPFERQRRQIQRDAMNVTWLADAADELAGMLRDSHAMLSTPPNTPKPRRAISHAAAEQQILGEAATPRARKDARAVLVIDPEAGGLGSSHALDASIAPGVNVLQATVARLLAAKELDGLVLACAEPDIPRVRNWLGPLASRSSIRFEAIQALPQQHARAIRAARACSRDSWRGGPGGLTIFDEAFDPATLASLMERVGVDAAVIVGPDWCLIDPDLIDAVVARYREQPDRQRLVFSQAAPGLAPCVLDRSMVQELAKTRQHAATSVFSTIGGALGYIPVAPIADPIAGESCIKVSAAARDLGTRIVADCPSGLAIIRAVWPTIASGTRLTGEPLATAITTALAGIDGPAAAPWDIHTSDAWSAASLQSALASAMRRSPSTTPDPASAIALAIRGDEPLDNPELCDLIRAAKAAGVASVHVRTRLQYTTNDDALLDRLIASSVDIISIDLAAHTPSTHAAIAAPAVAFETVRSRLDRLLALRQGEPGALPTPWVIPRITRRDAVYTEIEGFYDQWVLRCGAAVIDPLDAPIHGERIEPLSLPMSARQRFLRTRAWLNPDGSLTPLDDRSASTTHASGASHRPGAAR